MHLNYHYHFNKIMNIAITVIIKLTPLSYSTSVLQAKS